MEVRETAFLTQVGHFRLHIVLDQYGGFFLDCWWFVLLALLAAPTLAGWPGLNWFLNFNPSG